MKPKHLILIFLLSLFAVQARSQNLIQYPAEGLRLQMEQERGSNGGSVAYNPDQKIYYATFAGNSEYPLETFDQNGLNIARAEAGNDLRGIWWNPKTKSLEGNGYNDIGIISLGLKPDGTAGGGNRVLLEKANQPSPQSVGVYDPRKKEILFFFEDFLSSVNRKTGAPKKEIKLDIPPGAMLNQGTLIFTGVKKMEVGLLDYAAKQVYLFNRKDGSLTGTVHLPAGAPTEGAFNFSYTNGQVFLFDKEGRVWIGYRIFDSK